MGIVLGEEGIGELHHLHAAHAQSFLFEAVENFAHDAALHGAGLEEYEGLFECHSIMVF